MQHNRIAFIPARGGSKRLPRKNILPFLGRPIISYTIESAWEANLFDDVVVSTDDEEIADISQQYNATIVWREEELASDTATVTDVSVAFLKKQLELTPNLQQLCVLYATAPLRSAQDIISVVRLLNAQCHYALAVTDYYYDVHQALLCDGDVAQPVFPELINLQSERVPRYRVDNGSTYAVNAQSFLHDKTFFGAGLRVYFMPCNRSIDINDQYHFGLAEFFARKE